MRRFRLLLWPAGIALGLAAEQASFLSVPRHLLDLAVGWIFIACGLISASRRPESRVGALMTATGFAWFFWNFQDSQVAAIAWVAARIPFLYLGPLVHLVLTYPGGRAPSRLSQAAVVAGYGMAIATPIWDNDASWIVLALLLVSVSARDYVRTIGQSRRARLMALRVTSLLGAVIAGGALARFVLPNGSANGPAGVVFEVTLCTVAVILFAGMLSAPWERAAVTDLVVELGESRSRTLRDELSRALGDPTLEVGYWLPASSAFIDADGRPLSFPAQNPERSVTMLEHDGRPVAALVHDTSVLNDPGLLEAVSSAAQLAASNAQLQAEVRARVVELKASRRRVLEAGDEERRRLERRLRDGAEQRLEKLVGTLSKASEIAPGAQTRELIGHAEDQLGLSLEELGRLGRGLHPRELSERGLSGAIEALAERSEVPVNVVVTSDGVPQRVEAAAYFVCSEALANVAKYAFATRVTVSASCAADRLVLTIQDDGVGGADLTRGSGLLGLVDRVEALGGTLLVESPRGGGTRLVAEIPFGGETG